MPQHMERNAMDVINSIILLKIVIPRIKFNKKKLT